MMNVIKGKSLAVTGISEKLSGMDLCVVGG